MPLQPKKSRILASTSRQGNRQSRVQVERSEDEDATSETADTVESGTEDQSQELGTSPAKRSGQIGQIMEDVLDQQHRIRDTRKQKVLESYDTAYTTAQTSIGTLFDDHEKQAAAAHHNQLKALKMLLTEKAKVEKAMTTMLADLRQSYDVHSRDLEAALVAKTEELK